MRERDVYSAGEGEGRAVSTLHGDPAIEVPRSYKEVS